MILILSVIIISVLIMVRYMYEYFNEYKKIDLSYLRTNKTAEHQFDEEYCKYPQQCPKYVGNKYVWGA